MGTRAGGWRDGTFAIRERTNSGALWVTIDLTTLLNVVAFGAFAAMCWADWKVVENMRVRVNKTDQLVAELVKVHADQAQLMLKYASAMNARIDELESRHREFVGRASDALMRAIGATDTVLASMKSPPDEALEAMRGK